VDGARRPPAPAPHVPRRTRPPGPATGSPRPRRIEARREADATELTVLTSKIRLISYRSFGFHSAAVWPAICAFARSSARDIAEGFSGRIGSVAISVGRPSGGGKSGHPEATQQALVTSGIASFADSKRIFFGWLRGHELRRSGHFEVGGNRG
jgi:hypothetical protein